MKVRLIKLSTVEDYVKGQAKSRASFNEWITKIKVADWNKPNDIMKTFGSTDLLGNGCNRVVFNIGGNNYRMICHYVIGARNVHLFINWIGTHADYTLLCSRNEQYTIDDY